MQHAISERLTLREAAETNRRREILALTLRQLGCSVSADPPYHIASNPLSTAGVCAAWHRWNQRPPLVRAVAPESRVVAILWPKGISVESARRYAGEKGFDLPPAAVEVTRSLTGLWCGVYEYNGEPFHRVVFEDGRIRLEVFAGEAVFE